LLHATDPPVAMWPAPEISWLKGGAHCNLESVAQFFGWHTRFATIGRALASRTCRTLRCVRPRRATCFIPGLEMLQQSVCGWVSHHVVTERILRSIRVGYPERRFGLPLCLEMMAAAWHDRSLPGRQRGRASCELGRCLLPSTGQPSTIYPQRWLNLIEVKA
jgi:hypothetical protein